MNLDMWEILKTEAVLNFYNGIVASSSIELWNSTVMFRFLMLNIALIVEDKWTAEATHHQFTSTQPLSHVLACVRPF